MHITFRQLRLFPALAETGSVSAAARRTHVTQPAASMQLREVTDSIGLTLYEVVPRRVVLTEAGEELARTARAIADQWEGFGQSVAAIKGLTRGRLRVQVVSTAKYFVRRLLGARFAAQRFKPIVRLELGNNEAIREAVAGGLGLAVLSGHALEGRAANPGVRILPVVGFFIPQNGILSTFEAAISPRLVRSFESIYLVRCSPLQWSFNSSQPPTGDGPRH